MNFKVSSLGPVDVNFVDELMKKNSATLGFLPNAALVDHLTAGTVIGVRSQDGLLAGYLLYASYPERIRIVHLCVDQTFRGHGLARKLFDELKSRCHTQCVVRLNCRRDYEAHKVWRRLGFFPVEEKPGRSIDGHPLTCWEYRIREDKQLDLFKESASDQAVEVVIDAHVLFHFAQSASPASKPSKALLADFLVDQIHVRLTDEIFLEIDRQEDISIRRSSLGLANFYSLVTYDPREAEIHAKQLSSILPSQTASDKSDINHLAKTAASSVEIFVTQDQEILKRSHEIANLTNLQVVSPDSLVVRLHELCEAESYRSLRVSGQDLVWRRARWEDSERLLNALIQPGEVRGKLRETIQVFFSEPEHCVVEILWRGEEILGARSSKVENEQLKLLFVRAAKSKEQYPIEKYIVWDAVASCPSRHAKSVQIRGDKFPERLNGDLLRMGFERLGDDFYRMSLPIVETRAQVDSEVGKHLPISSGSLELIPDQKLIRLCSPVVLKDRSEAAFLIPIKPGYAMSLFDRQKASSDLFGGQSAVLMSWENAYYRRKSHHKMLRAPARLLWYESGKEGAITALSQLDSVDIAPPKDLFRKYRKLGTLEWGDIYSMCKQDTSTEIMALKFSHTFEFSERVSLKTLRELSGQKRFSVQSPSAINHPLFLKIVEAGFGGRS